MQHGNYAVLGHMGLGDAFIQKGLIRTIAESTTGETVLLCKRRYTASMLDLYDDMDVQLVFVDDDDDISPVFGSDGRLWQQLERDGFAVIPLGVHTGTGAWHLHDPANWARAYYRQIGVDPAAIYGRFGGVARDEEANRALYARAVEKCGERYTVLHDDAARGMAVREAWLPRDLPVVHVDDPAIRSGRITDYLLLLERAEAFVGIDSAFALMVDLCFEPGKGPRVRTVHTTPGRPSTPPDFYRGCEVVDHGFPPDATTTPLRFEERLVDPMGKRVEVGGGKRDRGGGS